MKKRSPDGKSLSRREREIMDIIYQLGEVSVGDVADRMAEAPSYDSVRVLLYILTQKGHLTHRKDGRRYIYSPTVSHSRAVRSAMRGLMNTFFSGSPSKAILAMLDMSSNKLSKADLDRIADMIEKGKKR
jgi:predicted transcriptional regulator